MRSSAAQADPRVLLICTRGDGRDGVFPIGLIQAANQLDASRRGVLIVELEPRTFEGVRVVVLHLHWDFNHLYFDELVGYIRASAPAAKIVVGGYIATVHPHQVLDTHDVDYCISGDYERPFNQLVDAILARRPDSWIRTSIPNVYSRAGAPLSAYRLSTDELEQLDGLNIDWFPGLEKYVLLQDSLNLLGLAKWTEEQYYPALILKGSFNQHCAYCVLSTQQFDAPCGPELFTYIGEHAFVEFLDACANWRGVNIFGDFAALDLAKILRLLDGKAYGFEVSVGDVFEELAIRDIDVLAGHFSKLWLGFRLLPSDCYLGEREITPEMFETPYLHSLVRLSEHNVRVSVGFWVHGGNLKPGCDFGPFADRFLFMDGWRRFPTQRPGRDNFARLVERSREFKQVNAAYRHVSVRCETRDAPARSDEVVIEFDPLTSARDGADAALIYGQDAGRLPRAEHDELGRFTFRHHVADGGPVTLDFVVFDEKAYIRPPLITARRFSVHLPGSACAREVQLTLVENIFNVVVRDDDGAPLARELLGFTAGDVRWHVSEQVVDEVRESMFRDLPAYRAIRLT